MIYFSLQPKHLSSYFNFNFILLKKCVYKELTEYEAL